MPTPKEQCFIDALDAYKDAFPEKDPKIEMFKDWYRDLDGTWRKAGIVKTFYHWINSILKTRAIVAGDQEPRGPGEPNPVQWRTPDLTAPDDRVAELKFTDSKGNIDPWGAKRGMGGYTQKQDQDAINKQADPNSGAISLDKDSCKCEERGEPEPVQKVEGLPSPYFAPTPAPGVPGIAPGVVEQAPGGGFGLPEFAIP